MSSTAPADRATRHLLGEFYSSGEMQSMSSTAPADRTTQHLLGVSYPSEKMPSVYSIAPADMATRHLLGEFYPSAGTQSAYSTTLADWAKYIRGSFNKESEILPKELTIESIIYSLTFFNEFYNDEKTASMIFFLDHCTWNVFFTGESMCFHFLNCLFDSGFYGQTHV